MPRVPMGYCENLWDHKTRIGPHHILHPTAHDDWAGTGEAMPSDIRFLIRDRLTAVGHEEWGMWNWHIQIDYMECRNCDYGSVFTTVRNDGLFHSPVVHHVTVFNLEG